MAISIPTTQSLLSNPQPTIHHHQNLPHNPQPQPQTGPHPQPLNRPWSDLFTRRPIINGSVNTRLEKVVTHQCEGGVSVPFDLWNRGRSDWEKYLVGYFIGKRPDFLFVEAELERQWRFRGRFDVTVDENLFYIKFSDPKDRVKILESEPTFISGKIFVIKPWTESLEQQRDSLQTIPIWVKVFNLPRPLWSRDGFSYVGSIPGEPLRADEDSITRKMVSFAKICVEVSMDFQYPKSKSLEGEGHTFNVFFEYPWKALVCKKCSQFGHYDFQCGRWNFQPRARQVKPVGIQSRRQHDGRFMRPETRHGSKPNQRVRQVYHHFKN